MMTEENWKDIPDSDGAEVSDLGRVRRHGEICQFRYDSEGYARVAIGGKRQRDRVHRLVAEAFCKRLEGRDVVNHKNENKKDNRASNLEWSTNRENCLLARKKGRHTYGKTPVVLTDRNGEQMFFVSQMDAARYIGCGSGEVCKTLKGKRKTCHGYKIAYMDKNDAERAIDADLGQLRFEWV